MKRSFRRTGTLWNISGRWCIHPLEALLQQRGILDGLDSNGLNMVRAGIALYGLYPSEEVDKNRVRLRPVMELKSAVTYIKDVEPGAAVSYGGTFVATVPCGWLPYRWLWDGIPAPCQTGEMC